MTRKFLTFLGFNSDSKEDSSSEFSRFIREASSGEKKKVFMEVARKASAEQKEIVELFHSDKRKLEAI
jgi:transposase